ncbi:MAG: Imidazole glycerol phosphate synthase subunit HisF [Fimbriimonadaceae bacterium]|nr:Imidazole glycerol phosphate synthase subunit HisF [Fimbriimonadaceae bacterium]
MPSAGRSRQLPRVIPCLLLQGQGLTKTREFRDGVYVGDAINAVKIFNDKEVDELMLLDIAATKKGMPPDFELIKEIATEAFMPFSFGGGIRTMDQIENLIRHGAEKVCLNTVAHTDPRLVSEAAQAFGSQSVIVSIDVRKGLLAKHKVYAEGGTRSVGVDVLDHARRMEDAGAGEIVIQSIDRDGTMNGYDLALVQQVSAAVGIPVVALGGAGGLEDLAKAVQAGASAVAAGSMFVFHGKHRAVLITYPTRDQLRSAFFGAVA